MSFEQFPTAVPDESKRVEDSDKARTMAEAGDMSRSRAAENREKLKKSWVPELKETFVRDEKSNELRAEKHEEDAATIYEIEKSAEGMNDEELLAAADKSIADEKIARETVYALRTPKSSASEEEKLKMKEQLKDAEPIWHQAGLRAHVLNNMIGRRNRERKEQSN